MSFTLLRSWPLLVVIFLGGCAATPESRVVGVWTVVTSESSYPNLPTPELQSKLETYVKSFMMKVRSDQTFVLAGQSIDGKWSRAGDKMTFTPTVLKEKKNAKPLTKPLMQVSAAGLEVLTGTLSAGDSKLTIEQPTPLGPIKVVLRKTA